MSLLKGASLKSGKTALTVNGVPVDSFDLDSTPVTKTDLGLGNVDNTADVDKPVSTAAAASLAGKLSLTEPGDLITSPDATSKSGVWTVDRAPVMRPPSRVISRFQSGHGWTAGADDTTVKLFTDRSYRGTTNGAGASLYLTSPTFTAQDWSTSSIRIILRVADPTRLQTCQAYVTMGTGNVVSAGIQANVIAGEWIIATIARSQFATSTGTPNWTGVTAIQVRLQDNSTAAAVVYLAAVELIPDLASTYPAGVMILECDDGYAGQLSQLAPVVAQRGIPVTFNVISDRFTGGSPTAGMSAADLRTLQDKYGWQISCHAYAQTVHNTLTTSSVLEQDFQRQKHWLRANGLHSGADHIALCPGTGSPVAEGAIMDALRRSFRSARVNSGFYETAIAGDPLRLRSVLFTGQTNTQIQAHITACAGAGGAYILALHDVISGATNGTSNSLPAPGATNLATVLDFAATAGMVFRTRADWLDGK